MCDSNNICFACLSNTNNLKIIHDEETDYDIFSEVKYVLPELTILELKFSLYICCSCLDTLRSYYKFKKKCLNNFNHFKEFIHKRDEHQNIIIKEEVDLSESDNVEENQEYHEVEYVKCDVKTEIDSEQGDLSFDNPLDKKSNRKLFPCSICHKNFSKKTNLAQHIKTHSGSKDFTCTICNKKFSQNVHLDTHMKVHLGIKDYKCLTCNKKFVQSGHLRRHMKVHLNIRDFECSVCKKRFSQKCNLMKHMKQHEIV